MAELSDQLSRYRSPQSIFEGDGSPEPPTAEELEQTIVAPGGPALLPVGIVYQAGWEEEGDGLARHARAAVRALAQAGFPVTLRSLPMAKMRLDDEIEPAVLREVGHIRSTSVGRAPLAIRQLVIHSHHSLEAVIAPAGARLSSFEDELNVYRSTIVYTSWERATVHQEIVEVLNRAARVWVPCMMNKLVFEAAGVKAVDVIPAPFEPEFSLCAGIAAPRGSEVVPRGKRFYAIGKWEPRKNYHALIGAFLSEFSMRDEASLFVKTYEWGAWENYPSVEESLEFWLGYPDVCANGWTRDNVEKRLRIVTKKLPAQKLATIHRDNNIYVTPSHGEAWDLPAFDARVAGNRLVYTGWGGAEDYAGPDDVAIQTPVGPLQWQANVAFEPVHPGYGWEHDALWAALDVADIRRALRAASPPPRRVLPPELYGRFGTHRVGALMLESLRRVSTDTVDVLLKEGSFG